MSNIVKLGAGGLQPFRFARGNQMETDSKKCGGSHSVYVAEVVYIQKDGKLFVVNVCRACGQVTFHEKQLSTPGTPALLLKEKENKNELQSERR
jgi:hypothetical protein